MTTRFPTRQYPYRQAGTVRTLAAAEDPLGTVTANAVVRFFLGQDVAPVIIDPATIPDLLHDPFAALVLAPGHRPQSLAAVLAVLDDAVGPAAVPGQRVYRVADGGQIAWTEETAGLDRHLRLVVTRHRDEDADLLISSAPPADSETMFLQIMAWDPQQGGYNFYERRRAIWSWVGSSWQALEPETRGRGPFDSHVNGGPVMKELKLPWLNWHSQAVPLRDDFFAPNDPLRTDVFYHAGPPAGLRGAEDLELIVRAGIARWTAARFDRRTQNDTLEQAPEFIRQLLTTTTVNLVSSASETASLGDDDTIRLPTTFFLNTDAIVDELMLPAALSRLKVAGAFYRACLQRYAVRLQDGGTSLDRDSFFAFAVPEAALEDRAVLSLLLKRGAVSRRLALSLLLVDFPNPVFSEVRAALMAYVPDELRLDGGADLDARFAAAVRASTGAGVAGSAEAAFLDLWDLPAESWEADLARRIEAYWAAVTARLQTAAGFDDVFRLAESRRRQFRKRPLAEFGLTLSVATALCIPDPLRMTEQADVVTVQTEGKTR